MGKKCENKVQHSHSNLQSNSLSISKLNQFLPLHNFFSSIFSSNTLRKHWHSQTSAVLAYIVPCVNWSSSAKRIVEPFRTYFARLLQPEITLPLENIALILSENFAIFMVVVLTYDQQRFFSWLKNKKHESTFCLWQRSHIFDNQIHYQKSKHPFNEPRPIAKFLQSLSRP